MNGKIARLPRDIRDQLNRRLEDNQPASVILPWLNTQAAVQQILRAQFNGVAISEQNLSQWRQGGFRQWLLFQNLLDTAANLDQAAAERPTDPAKLTENLALVLAASHAQLLAQWDGQPTPEFEAKVKLLERLTQNITRLQKFFAASAERQAGQQKQAAEKQAAEVQKARNKALAFDRQNLRIERLTEDYGSAAAQLILQIDQAETAAEIVSLSQPLFDLLQSNQTKSNQPSDPAMKTAA